MTRRHRPPVRQFAVRMHLEIPREHRKQHIGPGTRALSALMDAGYIRQDLTVGERAEIIRQMSLTNKQAQEEYIAAVLTGMEMIAKPDLEPAKAQTPGHKQRRRGRPKGSPLKKLDLILWHKMIAAYHRAHIEASAKDTDQYIPNRDLDNLLKDQYVPTRDVDNLLRQATEEASRETKTTTAASIRHRLVSRSRQCEINPQDLGLASLYFHEFDRAIQELPVGFASKPRRRKNHS
jgi:hypothetical protein